MYQDIQNENAKIMRQLEELDREYQMIQRNIEIQRELLIKERNRNSELKVSVDQKTHEVGQVRKEYDSVIE